MKKTIRDSRAAGEPLTKIYCTLIRAFHDDVLNLRIKLANAYPAATETRPILQDDRDDRRISRTRLRVTG